MSAGDGVRWNPRQNLRPAGMLQDAPPARSLGELRATKWPRSKIITESNPAGIYVPPGDPLFRVTGLPPVPPRPYRFLRDPITWGSIAGFIVIGVALYFLAGS